jgi:NAD(P)-dependent dehydrogenase (short-subunit alcohol dehydrogenase family)
MTEAPHAQLRASKWALILGASSGFGEGAARALAQAGYDIVGVHLDRRAGLEHVAEIRKDIERLGRKTQYFNINAADEEKRNEVLAELAKQNLNIAVLLHSLAFGTLKPYIGADVLNKANIDMTLDVMAHSLVYWSQGVVKHGLMGTTAGFSRASSGSTRVFATWRGLCREGRARVAAPAGAGRAGITVMRCQGDVTDTPRSARFPARGSSRSQRCRSHHRLTTPPTSAAPSPALSHPAPLDHRQRDQRRRGPGGVGLVRHVARGSPQAPRLPPDRDSV